MHELHTVTHGHDAGRGNLLGIQPWMEPADYASEQRFGTRLDAYLAAARERGFLGPRTVAVLPEHIGTWLAALGAPAAALHARTTAAAMARLAGRRPVGFARATLRAGRVAWSAGRLGGLGTGRGVLEDAALRMHGPRMARVFDRVMARLARRHGITLVAGSLVLPSPEIAGGRLRAGTGPLHNVAVVYAPDGRAHGRLVCKVRPVTRELGFVAAGALADLPVFDTPAGRLGVLVCADSWYPDTYAALRARGVDLLAVPAHVTPDGSWQARWRGYDGAPMPADVAPGDVGALTEREAWHRYALAGRLASAGARCGINVFLRGTLWDLGGDGASLAMVAGSHATAEAATEISAEVPPEARAALLNLWLP